MRSNAAEYQQTRSRGNRTGHRLASRTVRRADGSVYQTETVTRNPLGQPEKIAGGNPALTETRSYDAAHRVIGITDSRGNKTLTYDWSPGGLLNMMQDSDGHRTDYLYDGVGRLIGIWAPNFDYVAFSHDAGGRLTEKWFPNGTTARYAWNPDDSLAELENRTAANTVLTRHAYQYDPLGRRIRHTEEIGSLGAKYLQYGFDALSRLASVQSCDAAFGACATDEMLTYDIWDNRKTRTAAGATLAYVYDAAHQLKETRSGSDTGPLVASYAWDANGNQTSRPGQTLACTPDERLAGIGAESYAYDPQGRRIQKTVSGVAAHYLIIASICVWMT